MAAARMTAQGPGRPVLGKALLMLGGIFLVAQLALFSWHVAQYWDRTGARAMGGLSAAGMAVVQLVNTVAWNPDAALASSLQLLVLCWPLLLVASGVVLLRRNAAGR